MLKRKRADDDDMGPALPTDLPPLPALAGDELLNVYTDPSLPTVTNNAIYSDLGALALELATTLALFKRKPRPTLEELRTERAHLVAEDRLAEWTTQYNLTARLRRSAEAETHTITPADAAQLFRAYVGGVCAQSGQAAVDRWIHALISPAPKPEPDVKPQLPILPTASLNGVSRPGPSGQGYTSLLYEGAQIRRAKLEFQAASVGPPHALQWTMKCFVNDVEMGVGRGLSKQSAKEEASKQAYQALGWELLTH